MCNLFDNPIVCLVTMHTKLIVCFWCKEISKTTCSTWLIILFFVQNTGTIFLELAYTLGIVKHSLAIKFDISYCTSHSKRVGAWLASSRSCGLGTRLDCDYWTVPSATPLQDKHKALLVPQRAVSSIHNSPLSCRWPSVFLPKHSSQGPQLICLDDVQVLQSPAVPEQKKFWPVSYR